MMTQQIPDDVGSIKMEQVFDWTGLMTEADGHRLAVWEGGLIEEGFFREFGLILKVPEVDEDSVLHFPVLQSCTCEKTYTYWDEIPDNPHAHGGRPAPFLLIHSEIHEDGHSME